MFSTVFHFCHKNNFVRPAFIGIRSFSLYLISDYKKRASIKDIFLYFFCAFDVNLAALLIELRTHKANL